MIGALLARGHAVRAFVRSNEQAAALSSLGVQDIVVGDLRDGAALERLVRGCGAIYHICPNMHPDEVVIGRTFLDAIREVKRTSNTSLHLVYHSVLRPQIEAMPHHWAKLRVEEMILTEASLFTILQPAPYYQNVLAQRDAVQDEGRYPVPYCEDTLLGMVDLADVAEVAADALTNWHRTGGIYELTCTNHTPKMVANVLAAVLGRPVEVAVLDRAEWEHAARVRGMNEYAISTLLAMFRYYEVSGLRGNPAVLRALLDREPTAFAEFAARAFGRHA